MVPTQVIPAFHEAWFSDESCAVLAGLVADVENVPGDIVEVGSWEGRSTVALANAALPRNVVAVDTWAGSPGEISQHLARKRDVYAQFSANVQHFTRGNVLPYVMPWDEYVRDHGQPCALVFIDALHTYDEVLAQVRAFRPLLSAGGVLCGDDAHHAPVLNAVAHAFHRHTIERKASLWIVRP